MGLRACDSVHAGPCMRVWSSPRIYNFFLQSRLRQRNMRDISIASPSAAAAAAAVAAAATVAAAAAADQTLCWREKRLYSF